MYIKDLMERYQIPKSTLGDYLQALRAQISWFAPKKGRRVTITENDEKVFELFYYYHIGSANKDVKRSVEMAAPLAYMLEVNKNKLTKS